ncbi:MAG TPA: hypothetical protein VGM66_09955 [Candidatus Udaeobacter sp.]|jgi:hypothetical protein
MIRKPTVLVLGAGASAEYGFPTGRSLLLHIVRELRGSSRLHLDMAECGFSDDLIKQFSSELSASNQPSVDAFLEQHKNNTDYENLGKAAIASSLIRFEDTPAMDNRDDLKLYEYIWGRASATPATYAANALSILTFNYDRSFDEFLRRSLCASHPEFRTRDKPFEVAVSHFPIVHLYGSLGSVDENHDSYLKYGGADNPSLPPTIRAAAKRIKLYHQAKFDQHSVDLIHERIETAETICFLGFGFYPMNIKILQFCGLGKNKSTKHYASSYGLMPGEERAALEALGLKVEFARGDLKCLAALRWLPVLVSG